MPDDLADDVIAAMVQQVGDPFKIAIQIVQMIKRENST